MQRIPFERLNYHFMTPPLLVGGMAMEFYDLRKTGADIDFIITPEDHANLVRIYPDHIIDLWGDIGVCVDIFEIWRTICLYGYDELSPGAVDQGDFLVISMEKLMFLKTLAIREEKYRKDVELLSDRIKKEKYDPWWALLGEEQRQKYLASQT